MPATKTHPRRTRATGPQPVLVFPGNHSARTKELVATAALWSTNEPLDMSRVRCEAPPSAPSVMTFKVLLRPRLIQMTAAAYAREHDHGGGVCLACGELGGGVKPDAEGCECSSCGARAVCGLEQALLIGRLVFMPSATD